ncbi:MAG TPA: hypothetical protein VF796_07505 [Humisphaera sp.]
MSAFAAAAGNLTAAVEGTLPPTAVQGDRGRAAVRVANTGEAAVRGPVTVRLVASADDVADAGDSTLAEVTRTVRLRPGAAKAFRFKFEYPAGVAGAVRLIGVVVPGDGVRESDTADDVGLSAATVEVVPASVDLVPVVRPLGFAQRPERARTGVVVDVANLGNVRFDGPVAFHLELVGVGAGATTAVGDPVVRMKVDPGTRTKVKLRFVAPAGLPLDQYRVTVDLAGGGALAETDLSNNAATSPDAFAIVHRG